MAESFPWFNWFPRDWIAGTAELTPEQKGAYVDLLCYAWEQNPPCSLPDDDAVLARLSGLGARWRKVGAPVRAKFEPIDGGRLRNDKQWRVYLDMCEHREKRRKAAAVSHQSRRNAIAMQPAMQGAKGVANTLANTLAETLPPQPLPQKKEVTDAVSTKPAVASVENSGESPHAYLMPILRKHRYDCDQHDGSIIKALVRKKVKTEDIEAAVVGLALMRDRGGLDWMGVSRENKLSMRILYADSEGKKPVWREAEEEYWRNQPNVAPNSLKPLGVDLLKRALGA